MTTINQKEYLKKYLGIGKAPGEKKKKKKKEKVVGNRLKIIDDDVDVQISKEIEEDIATANEYAPQIVAVIDERPHSLQVDEKTNSSLWKPIGGPSTIESDDCALKLNSFKLGKSVKQPDHKYASCKKNNSMETKLKQANYSDYYSRKNDREKSNSPPRRRHREEHYSSPKRKEDNDYSPPRTSAREDSSTSRNNDSDYSPPRKKVERELSSKKKKDNSSPSFNPNVVCDSSPIKRNGDDNSPPRRRNNDNSPLRRRNSGDDSSPPRRKNKNGDDSPLRKRIKEEDNSPPRIKNYEDNSPPRRRKDENLKAKMIDDYSPQRKIYKDNRKKREREYSPTNRSKSDISPTVVRIKSEDRDMSPSRKNKRKNRDGKKSRWNTEEHPESLSGEKMEKTLDGKRAGLQSAKDLSKESKVLRQKEDEIFNNMSAEISGRDATTVVRGKKVKDVEEEAAKAKREQEMKEKYDRWGKGLKQVEDQNKIIEDQLHEMSKPLARYADDEDLEKFLKEQEREGDPMLAYIRKKKKKEKVAAGIPEKPMYMGEFMPNRFGIRPGYRWDGVDRSNGYEKKWFQVQNAKKANREEAFKWSTEDM